MALHERDRTRASYRACGPCLRELTSALGPHCMQVAAALLAVRAVVGMGEAMAMVVEEMVEEKAEAVKVVA